MKIIFASILLASLLLFSIPLAYSETSKLIKFPIEDSSVDEDRPSTTLISTTNPVYAGTSYGDWIFLPSGTTNTIKYDSDDLVTNHAYLKFNVEDIPQSNAFKIVEIEAKLGLLVQGIDGSKRTLITVHSCKDNPTNQDNKWRQATINWDNRPCVTTNEFLSDPSLKNKSILRGEDTKLIEESELPGTFSWDVSRSVSDARNDGDKNITLVVSTVPLTQVDNFTHDADFKSKLGTSLAWIWSSELKQYGANAAPTLIVTYSENDSPLMTFIEFALVALIPAIAIVIPAAFWLMQRNKKKS